MEDTDEDLVGSITDAYDREECVEEIDKEVEEIAKITIPVAIKALQYLRLYEEQQEAGNSEIITRLTQYEKEVKKAVDDTLVQSSIKNLLYSICIWYIQPTFDEYLAIVIKTHGNATSLWTGLTVPIRKHS